MQRSAPARRRSRWAAALVCAALAIGISGGAVPAQPAQQLTFTLPEARALALQAAMGGRPDVALSLTQQLLDQDPEDAQAHLARSAAFLAKRDWGAAYKGGRMAFRFAQTKDQKFQAARVTSTAALGGERQMLSQFWMRRAGDLAPTEVDRKKIEQQFNYLKAKSPWNLRFRFGATPSSNVNGGADSAFNTIDGAYIYLANGQGEIIGVAPLPAGTLSPSAQALSGVVTRASVFASYRLNRTETSQTHLTGHLSAREVFLSQEAKDFAPGFDAGLLSEQNLSLGFAHSRALGDAGSILGLRSTLKRHMQGGAHSFHAISAGASLRHPLSDALTFDAGFNHEARKYGRGGNGEVQSANLGLTYRFANGNKLSGALFGTQNATPNIVLENDTIAAQLRFSLGEPVLSMLLSAGLGYAETHYPNYWVGVPVPGGRKDEAVFFDINATFTKLEYAGFSPSVKLRRKRTDSNVSRFDTAEWALSFGLQSNF
ncbi:hypothetical protein AIOL_001220 [Candidatus Rhodobacter oscarellae]|uniref:TPR repeat n=1 Tax=Candidatus Rhodobacter oscarellae TaxID=1675527 RepID=A0A0J9GS12_9RHOB|nr:hypothetical protein [Candidatus Rhodobacter lobularis]KMW56268.1 hypothetical protein AIOL_001220 [Candidatus Rhodobacter lobularis]